MLVSLFPADCHQKQACAAVAICAVSTTACQDEPIQKVIAPPGEVPTQVSVAGTDVSSGFATGTLRRHRSVALLPDHETSNHPATIRKLRTSGSLQLARSRSACANGALTPYQSFETPNYDHEVDGAPAVCVGERHAETYCDWIGGRLPTLDEWLLAARGDTPRRYSWGTRRPIATSTHGSTAFSSL